MVVFVVFCLGGVVALVQTEDMLSRILCCLSLQRRDMSLGYTVCSTNSLSYDNSSIQIPQLDRLDKRTSSFQHINEPVNIAIVYPG